MNCTICLNEVSSVVGMYNDCVIESLEKIKTHYMSLKKQLSEKEAYISKLTEMNESLNESIECYEKKARKIPRTASAQSQTDLEQSVDFDNPNISKDDFNRAVNDENDFEVSFTQNSICPSQDIKPNVKREPMKSLPLSAKRSPNNSSPQFRRVAVKDEHDSYRGKREDTKTWFSKNCENRIKMNESLRNCSKSTRNVKKNIRPRLALKTGGLRQTRLQLDVCKNTSNEDSTFCEEAIEASPQHNSSLKKTNSSRQWMLRNNSKKGEQSPDDSTFNASRASTGKSFTEHPQKPIDEKLDTSSVVMLTPATQDVIFLDDSCESFNVESMDLLKGLINPTENNMCNLRKIESERIKMLQKTVSEKIENKNKSHPLSNIEGTNQSNINLQDIKSSFEKENDKKFHSKDIRNEDGEKAQRQRLFNVDCNECQAYIKYLGDRLSDKQIEDHIRNCTKHKKRVEINLTPDGFWDPLIQPLDKNDPRNETLIDTRFINKDRHN